MSLESLHPFAGNHAIQSVAFVFEWPTPLDTATLRVIRSLEPQLRLAFPVVQEQQNVTVQIEAGKVAKAKYHQSKQQPTQLAGVQFLNPGHAVGQFSRMIQVQRQNCVIVVNDYSRWDTVWPRVQAWLDAVLSVALSGRPLTAVMLQYNDVFLWKDAPELLDPSEIFVKDSPYLAPNILGLKTAWHSHHGFIEQMDGPWPAQVLDNINISVGDINGQRQVGALLSHKSTFSTPIWSFQKAKIAIDEVIPQLHDRNKSRLKLLLSDAVRQKVGLLSNSEIAE